MRGKSKSSKGPLSTRKDANGKFAQNDPGPLAPVIRTPAEIIDSAFARLDGHAIGHSMAVENFKKQVAEDNLFYALDTAGDRAIQGDAYLRTHKRFRDEVEKFRFDPIKCVEYAKGYLASQIERVVRDAEYPSLTSSSSLKNITKEAERRAEAMLVHAIQIFVAMAEDAARPQEVHQEAPTETKPEGTKP